MIFYIEVLFLGLSLSESCRLALCLDVCLFPVFYLHVCHFKSGRVPFNVSTQCPVPYISAISCDAEKDQIVEIKIILRYDVDYDKYAAGKESEVEK